MGAPKIRQSALKLDKKLRRELKHGHLSTIAIAVDPAGKILGAGVDHGAVGKKLGTVEGGYEVREFVLWQ